MKNRPINAVSLRLNDCGGKPIVRDERDDFDVCNQKIPAALAAGTYSGARLQYEEIQTKETKSKSIIAENLFKTM